MSRDRIWRLRTTSFPLDRPLIMGILNVTPDSFSDGGQFLEIDSALRHARRLQGDGSDLIDVGGESTRPGASPVGVEEELGRVIPVVEALTKEGMVVSIDTSKPQVAQAALAVGAEVVNDVTGGSQPGLLAATAAAGAGLILMHMRGEPATMQADPHYEDVLSEVASFLTDRAAAAVEAGVTSDRICIDPGIGFGKAVGHNVELIRHLDTLKALGFPVLVGASRKRFLGHLTGIDDPKERDLASAVMAALAVERGADVLRVHNVSACREAVAVAMAIVARSGG